MKISYNWLKDLIPEIPPPQNLSNILTAVGLEVESLEKFEDISGSLAGLVVGKVLYCEKHPAADHLKVTRVDAGQQSLLQIVCGADNVSVGLMVIVAPAGSTIYPLQGEPVAIKKVKIRGIESQGMICAEDEIGIGSSHEGIVVLPEELVPGSAVADQFNVTTDWVFELGITPNRVDAMSHTGVARDVCAYLLHHNQQAAGMLLAAAEKPFIHADAQPVEIVINTPACERYSGVSIVNIHIAPSPKWMQARLRSIGLKPVNNIVDITNYVLHETGQPLHAFDLRLVRDRKVIVRELPAGTSFTTLDERERSLYAEDVMICNGANQPMCLGGVFGGLKSGIKSDTTAIFLESAWFNPSAIRRTSLRHKLRTDAAIRFEKGVDISKTAIALQRAISLISSITGGEVESNIIDVYPHPKKPLLVTLRNQYLTRIAGKEYHRKPVKGILQALGFKVEKEGEEDLTVAVPFSKPDVTLPADLVEEIMRIDGLDNVAIPSSITITPQADQSIAAASSKEKIAQHLTGLGFSEIFTNSITNSKYYSAEVLTTAVKIVNSLSADLDIMQPSVLETGLESIVYNINRKNADLLFFEFTHTYSTTGIGEYQQREHLCMYVSGFTNSANWNQKARKMDLYFLKGVCDNICKQLGSAHIEERKSENNYFDFPVSILIKGEVIGEMGGVANNLLKKFDIKQPVYFADFDWKKMLRAAKTDVIFKEIPKFPAVKRDLSIVVNKNTKYAQVQDAVKRLKIEKLEDIRLFDVFESEKLGIDKKAFAINLTFIDREKTLTDRETDTHMNKIAAMFKDELGAQIRE